MSRRRVGVLISGRGSNMQALAEAATDPSHPAEIVLVAANDPEAGGLAWAAGRGLATAAVDHRPFGRNREAHERALDTALRNSGVELVCLAGYMRLLTPWFTGAWAGRLLNIHPSLLPLFPGLHTHRRALEAGVKLHGCTVHQVVEAVDAGPILGQAAVPVLAGDDEETLAARVLSAEHRLYPAVLAKLCGSAASALNPSNVLLNV